MTMTGKSEHRNKSVPVPLCPWKITYGLAWDRRRATAGATAYHKIYVYTGLSPLEIRSTSGSLIKWRAFRFHWISKFLEQLSNYELRNNPTYHRVRFKYSNVVVPNHHHHHHHHLHLLLSLKRRHLVLSLAILFTSLQLFPFSNACGP
jgi:hypothetical protein